MAEQGAFLIYEHARSLEELRLRIKERIRQGWQVYGQPVSITDLFPSSPTPDRVSQAFLKYYDEPVLTVGRGGFAGAMG
jgi:hypothetical protein